MKRIDFNANWTVTSENGKTRQVNLPDDAMILEERRKDSPTNGSSGYFLPGKYTYEKKWNVPLDLEGKNVILECEGVYQNSHIILNGEELYARPYGYTNYFVDLSKKLNFGEENTITIVADNSMAPNSRWYSGSGIYREVALHIGEQTSIAPEGIKVKTTSKDSIEVSVEILNPADDIDVVINILDNGQLVSNGCGSKCEIHVPNAINWSENNPKLYECEVILKRDGQVIDNDTVRFGIRTITWNSNGLFINGESTLLRGGCIHHDNGILGACNFRDAEYRRAKQMKDAGFNAIRMAHNPMSKAMLDACDELGIYVMDENFDMWFIHKNPYDYGKETFEKWWKIDTKQMIDKDFSHPCVIMYSIGNEISDLGAPMGQAMCKEMSDYVRELDSTRVVTAGLNLMLAAMVAKGNGMYGNEDAASDEKDSSKENNANDNNSKKKNKKENKAMGTMDSAPTSEFYNMLMGKFGKLMGLGAKYKSADKIVEKISYNLDIPGYNYAGPRYKKEAKIYPNRAFVGSETLPQELYSNWQLVKEIPQCVGDFMWTGYDYLGEAGIGTYRYVDKKTGKLIDENLIILGGPGVIDITGLARPEVQWNKLIWGLSTEPEIAVAPVSMAPFRAVMSPWRATDAVASWSFDGCDGYESNVTVYATGKKVQLSVNGNVIGTKKIKDNKAIFKKVTYHPGEILATVYDENGYVCGTKKLVSATGNTRINASADKNTLNANGQDLCFIDITLVGENGVLEANKDTNLTIKVNGPATLQGFGSARPAQPAAFNSDTHKTYYGHALAVVRAGYETGDVEVTISGEGLDDAKLKLCIN